FRADTEADEAGSGSGARPCRRAARALIELPRVARHAAEPLVTLRESAERQLRDEDRAGLVELAHDGRVHVDDLVLVRLCAERRAVAPRCKQVLRAPGDAVERPAIPACSDLGVHPRGLLERTLLGER